jgi:hypothetical protein
LILDAPRITAFFSMAEKPSEDINGCFLKIRNKRNKQIKRAFQGTRNNV